MRRRESSRHNCKHETGDPGQYPCMPYYVGVVWGVNVAIHGIHGVYGQQLTGFDYKNYMSLLWLLQVHSIQSSSKHTSMKHMHGRIPSFSFCLESRPPKIKHSLPPSHCLVLPLKSPSLQRSASLQGTRDLPFLLYSACKVATIPALEMEIDCCSIASCNEVRSWSFLTRHGEKGGAEPKRRGNRLWAGVSKTGGFGAGPWTWRMLRVWGSPGENW